jgi:hypothetical protein
MTDTTTLYRPVGRAELALIEQSGWRAFPPRLEHQPFFYPVANEAYAVQIARDWNTRDAASGYAGYVTRFAVDAAFLDRYPLQTAGAAMHKDTGSPRRRWTTSTAPSWGASRSRRSSSVSRAAAADHPTGRASLHTEAPDPASAAVVRGFVMGENACSWRAARASAVRQDAWRSVYSRASMIVVRANSAKCNRRSERRSA